MNLNSFKKFKEIKKDSIDALNEAWKSKKIMGLIDQADKNSERAWYKSFVKDFYTQFNISVDQLKDKDFKEIDPKDFFGKKPYSVEPDKYLAVFINDDKKLIQDAKEENAELQLEIKQAIKDGKSKQEIEELKALIDATRELRIPILVAIGMGKRAVYYGFKDELDLKHGKEEYNLPPARKKKGIQYGAAHKALRYGINPSMWLQKRYFGLDKGELLTAANTADRSTKAFVVDIEELKSQYDMGTKLKDRELAKVDNPNLMSNDEIATLNKTRYAMKKNKDVNPKSLLKDLQDIVTAYSDYYTDAIKNVNDASFKSLKNQSIKFEDQEFTGLAEVFEAFTAILGEYFAVHKKYAALMKDTPAKIKKLRGDKKISRQSFDIEGQRFIQQHDQYIMEMIELKKKAERMAVALEKAGVKFQ